MTGLASLSLFASFGISPLSSVFRKDSLLADPQPHHCYCSAPTLTGARMHTYIPCCPCMSLPLFLLASPCSSSPSLSLFLLLLPPSLFLLAVFLPSFPSPFFGGGLFDRSAFGRCYIRMYVSSTSPWRRPSVCLSVDK
jgi:hypothetical protein